MKNRRAKGGEQWSAVEPTTEKKSFLFKDGSGGVFGFFASCQSKNFHPMISQVTLLAWRGIDIPV
jgi:hypothetical protein